MSQEKGCLLSSTCSILLQNLLWNIRIFITEKVSLAKFLDWWLKDWCTLKIEFAAILSIIFQAVSRSSIIPSMRKQFMGCPMMIIRMISRPTVFKNRCFFGDLCPNKYNLAVWASCPAVQTSHIGAIIFAPYSHIAHILGKLCNILSLSLLNTLVLSLRHTPTLPTYWESFATSCHYLYWTL